jgi:hypothetical protein
MKHNLDKNIINYNSKGKSHGYQQGINFFNGKLSFRANFKNGSGIGYVETHRFVQTLYIIR